MSFSGSPVHYLGLPDLVFAACSQVGLPTQKSRSRGTQYAFAIKISHGHFNYRAFFGRFRGCQDFYMIVERSM